MRQAVSRHQDGPVPTNYGHGRLTQMVFHARTGMLIKAPWEQYMVHLRAYPFKGLEFHGRNPQNWILYVLNTFAQGVDALDPLNPPRFLDKTDS